MSAAVDIQRRPFVGELLGRSDGLVWSCDDVDADGTHPSKTGVQKVVSMLTAFFKTDPTARRWFVAR